MNLYNNVWTKMEYIQKVFLSVQDYMQQNHELEELIIFLDKEPPEFRSVAYESASMEIALPELSSGSPLNNWKKFCLRSEKAHTFHSYIGLGWAFAKTDISPKLYSEFMNPSMLPMVYDGIGYYYGLFKVRKTVKNQLVPGIIEEDNLYSFDQGLGRRLWYICRGEVNELMKLIEPFHLSRHANLWRGVGIACGYVGGCAQHILEELLSSSNVFNKQLCAGIKLAAISRNASNSVSPGIELACSIICGESLKDILNEQL